MKVERSKRYKSTISRQIYQAVIKKSKEIKVDKK